MSHPCVVRRSSLALRSDVHPECGPAGNCLEPHRRATCWPELFRHVQDDVRGSGNGGGYRVSQSGAAGANVRMDVAVGWRLCSEPGAPTPVPVSTRMAPKAPVRVLAACSEPCCSARHEAARTECVRENCMYELRAWNAARSGLTRGAGGGGRCPARRRRRRCCRSRSFSTGPECKRRRRRPLHSCASPPPPTFTPPCTLRKAMLQVAASPYADRDLAFHSRWALLRQGLTLPGPWHITSRHGGVRQPHCGHTRATWHATAQPLTCSRSFS